MHLTIQKWGNSLALRIPKAVAKQVNVQKGSMVDMSLQANKIILSAVSPATQDLESLLKMVNKGNSHSEQSWGRPAGKEIW